MDDQLITIREFCALFRVGRTRTYQLLNSGAIEAVKNGVSTRIVLASARKWAAALPRIPPKPSQKISEG